MPEWIISIISVIVGAAIVVGATELVQFIKRPKLKIEADSKLTWDIKLHPNYSSNEYNKRYAPIDIKKQDTEYLDFSSLQYSRSKSDDDLNLQRRYIFQRILQYKLTQKPNIR